MSLDDELSDLLIISLEQAVAAPYCGLLLASAGARVIKVERPEGDFARSYDNSINGKSAIFAWLNRGKESISLDLKNKTDKKIFKNMLKKADVFLSNLTPGSLEKLELDYKQVKALNPKLIFCEITGYGNSKLAHSKKAYDFLIQAESGLCSVTGTEKYPSKVGISITDLSTGLTAYSAILRGIIKRSKTKKGISISISMFDVMADWMNMPLLAHRYMGGTPKRNGMKHSFIAPYGTYKCKNNDEILISIQNNREFEVFCKKILKNQNLFKNPKFQDNPNRYKNRHELDKIINSCFLKYTKEELQEKLDTGGIANAFLNNTSDLSDHKLLKNENAVINNEYVSLAALPIKTSSKLSIKVPSIDENGKKLRSEFNK